MFKSWFARFRNIPDKDTDKFSGLDQRLSSIENAQNEINKLLRERTWSVDKIVIEEMHTDKVELNLGDIDIKELGGMLIIGFNYGGKLLKMEPPGEQKNRDKKETPPPDTRKSPAYKGGGNDVEEPLNNNPKGPVIKVSFGESRGESRGRFS